MKKLIVILIDPETEKDMKLPGGLAISELIEDEEKLDKEDWLDIGQMIGLAFHRGIKYQK